MRGPGLVCENNEYSTSSIVVSVKKGLLLALRMADGTDANSHESASRGGSKARRPMTRLKASVML